MAESSDAVVGGVVGYVLTGYPILSQTFVRDEIMTLRSGGVEVDVTSMAPGDQARIPLSWSGPYRTIDDLTVLERARDLGWWLLRPRAVLRLLTVLRASGWAGRRTVLSGVPTVARRLASRPVRVLHTHFGWRAMIPTVYLGALLDVPVTVTLHAADIYLAPPGFTRRVNLTDRVFTVCGYNVERLTALGVDPAKLTVVPCGVDVDVELHPVEDPMLVLSVGRLVAKKGMDVLVRAFALVRDAVPQARLEIVGEGPEEEMLRALVAELDLGDHVRFAGALDHDATLERIGQAGVFALACRVLANGDSDAVPVAIREAMARARPVVTTGVAGIPENVDDEVGWVVPSEEPELLARALIESLLDPALSARKGAAARQRQADHYTLEHSRQLLLRHWSELVATAAARRQ